MRHEVRHDVSHKVSHGVKCEAIYEVRHEARHEVRHEVREACRRDGPQARGTQKSVANTNYIDATLGPTVYLEKLDARCFGCHRRKYRTEASTRCTPTPTPTRLFSMKPKAFGFRWRHSL